MLSVCAAEIGIWTERRRNLVGQRGGRKSFEVNVDPGSLTDFESWQATSWGQNQVENEANRCVWGQITRQREPGSFTYQSEAFGAKRSSLKTNFPSAWRFPIPSPYAFQLFVSHPLAVCLRDQMGKYFYLKGTGKKNKQLNPLFWIIKTASVDDIFSVIVSDNSDPGGDFLKEEKQKKWTEENSVFRSKVAQNDVKIDLQKFSGAGVINFEPVGVFTGWTLGIRHPENS